MDVKIRKTAAQLTLDENGKLLMLTAHEVICEDGCDVPENDFARARHYADPNTMYGTPLTVQFSYGQDGDPVKIADGILAALGY